MLTDGCSKWKSWMSGMEKVIWGLTVLLHTCIFSHLFRKKSNKQKQGQDSGFPLETCKVLCNNLTLRCSKGRNILPCLLGLCWWPSQRSSKWQRKPKVSAHQEGQFHLGKATGLQNPECLCLLLWFYIFVTAIFLWYLIWCE